MDEAIKEAFGNKFKTGKKKPAKAKSKTKTGKTRSTSRRPPATTLN
jgi:hypothetical protein